MCWSNRTVPRDGGEAHFFENFKRSGSLEADHKSSTSSRETTEIANGATTWYRYNGVISFFRNPMLLGVVVGGCHDCTGGSGETSHSRP